MGIDPVWPWLAVMVVALLVGASLAWRQAAVQRRTEESLREAREWTRCLGELVDCGTWQTDRSHRLVRLCPPRRAPASATSSLALGVDPPLLWEHLGIVDEAALKATLDRRGPIDAVEIAPRAGLTGPAWRGRLSGRVRTDPRGEFAGYQGTLSVEAAAPAPSPAALDAEQDAFSTIVSHDLRAPIRVVEGFTRILKEDYGRSLDRIGNDHLDRVLGAAARMNSMIDALLALAKLSSQPLARQPVNLSQLAGYVAEDLRRQWPDREVVLHVQPGMQVLGDPTLLRLVIENLLGNAWKYTAKARQPEVWFERRPDEPDTFTVRDNGAGFDMRFADRLFGAFQRLHSASDFQGTGVGLASVRRIVRRHGGEIWAEAEVDRGASFHFSLPQR